MRRLPIAWQRTPPKDILHRRTPPLPFPSLLLDDREALSDGDVDALAIGWGSRPYALIDDAAGPWTRARRMVTRFAARVVELDTLRADKLRGVR